MTVKNSFLDVPFDVLSANEVVEDIFAALHSGQRSWLCTVNVAILMQQRKHADLRQYIRQARWVVADGKPIVWFSRFFGPALPERVTGVDLIEKLARRAAATQTGIYLLGGDARVVRQARKRLLESVPDLWIAGDHSGYFSGKDAAEVAREISESGADILIVGMGVPRQERFIMAHWARLGVKFAMAVGGSFDVLGGLRRRAPPVLQRLGLEWAFRLAQEPRRLWKRYLVTNSQFLALMIRHLARRLFIRGTKS